VSFVELKSVVKRYGSNTILQNVDLSIEKGEMHHAAVYQRP